MMGVLSAVSSVVAASAVQKAAQGTRSIPSEIMCRCRFDEDEDTEVCTDCGFTGLLPTNRLEFNHGVL